MMTEIQKANLADEYKKLQKRAEIERAKRFSNEAVAVSLEESMARIETRFQQGDVDIEMYL